MNNKDGISYTFDDFKNRWSEDFDPKTLDTHLYKDYYGEGTHYVGDDDGNWEEDE